ncbi:hypothetical protein [Amycolatopsis suaedae]|uniref:Lipoprotein n=1 Tax=Amycolatopsis suaedae TaxID=2510978 RepID=A0A4Q7JB94_9PSEU|nr:hypothetical protein [Amycolatopsis suaedae]RZQ64348.1 hypothetical protein EWH70_10285 [Amycolatopsis suaedae]
MRKRLLPVTAAVAGVVLLTAGCSALTDKKDMICGAAQTVIEADKSVRQSLSGTLNAAIDEAAKSTEANLGELVKTAKALLSPDETKFAKAAAEVKKLC